MPIRMKSAVRARAVPLAVSLFVCASAAMPQAASAQAAQASQAAPITLLQAYKEAFEQDATMRAARAATDAKRERVPQARSQLLPNVSASYGANKNELHSVSPGLTGPVTQDERYNSSNKSLTIRQPLYRPYQTADLKQAYALVADANAQLDRETQNLAVRVAGAYLEALLAQDQLALVQSQKTAFAGQLESARKRFAGGAGVRTDIDEARAKLDLTVAQELEARQNVDSTRRALQLLVNRPVGTLARLAPDQFKPGIIPPGQLEDWLGRAEVSSPELRSLAAQRDAARLEIEKARAGHKPTLDAVAQWSISDSDNVTRINSRYNNKSIGIQLNVPIFAGGYVSSQVRQATADLERAEQALEATRRDLEQRVEREFRGVTEGAAKIGALEQAVASAETAVVSSRRSFEGGARTIIDILNAEQQRVSAQRDLAQARYMYVISAIRLRALAGEADDAALAQANGWFR